MKNFGTVPQLIFLFDTITSLKSNANYSQNWNNYTIEQLFGVINFPLEEGNVSVQDLNFTNLNFYDIVERVASPIDVYFTPCLFTLGITGNMLTVFVFFSSKLRHQSTSQYLSALAISDSIFLAELLPPWLSTMEINSVFHQDVYCKGFVYVSYVSCCLSSWLVIAFTAERFVAVQYPLQCPSVCTVRRARYIIVSLTIGAMMVNLPVIHFIGSGNQICNIDKEKLEQAAKFNWVDTTVTFTIPLILIIILNTRIAVRVYKLERDRLKLTQEELRVISMRLQKSSDNDFVYRRSQRRITNMLLIVSSIFVLFNCPAYTLRICGYAYDMDASDLDDKWLKAQSVATMMFNANFGINFFLYCLTGQNFRRALVQTVPCFGWIARKIRSVFNRSPPNDTRGGSVTTSAASTGTDATCMEMSFVRPRSRRRSRNYIMRWTFDNSRQRRAAAESGESISMQEFTPQPGPSRIFIEERPQPLSVRALSPDQARAIEPMYPTVESRRLAFASRHPAINMRRSAVDMRRSAIATRRAAIDTRRPIIDTRRSVTDIDSPDIDVRRSVVDTRRGIIDPMSSTIESAGSANIPLGPGIEVRRSAIEPRRPVISQVVVVERRRASRLRRFLQLFRQNSAQRRRETAYLYD